MLTKPLSEIRRELQIILTEDPAATIVALADLLPEGGDKHTEVLQLRTRLNQVGKERIRGTISQENYTLEINRIASALMDLIVGLAESDFQPKANTASGASTARTGSVLYRIPNRMPILKPAICKIRVALDEEQILEDIVIDQHVRLRPQVEVSDNMSAELLDPEGGIFKITPLSAHVQRIREQGYTEWLFNVTPQSAGEHQLLVKVSLMEFDTNINQYVPREVSILETVTIVTDTPAAAEVPDTALKNTGESLVVGPDQPQSAPAIPPAPAPAPREILINSKEPSVPYDLAAPVVQPNYAEPTEPVKSMSSNKGLKRAMALVLAFVMFGSATWAFTPAATRDWWVASFIDTAESYQDYIEKHGKDKENERVEQAWFRKAEITDNLYDWRTYEQQFYKGKYYQQVKKRLVEREEAYVKSIEAHPDVVKVRQYLADYPAAEQIARVSAIVDQHQELRAELRNELEDGYVRSIKSLPSAEKIAQYSRLYPEMTKLATLKDSVDVQSREVQQKMQQAMTTVVIEKAKDIKTKADVEAILPMIQSMSQEAVDSLEKTLPAPVRKMLIEKRNRKHQ